MTAAFWIFIVLGGWAAYLTIWGHSSRARLAAVLLLTLTVPAALAVESVTLSRPLPTSMEWWLREVKEATVLGATLEEDSAIYLWLQVPGAEEPRYYVMPWDKKAAEQLLEALREAEQQGSSVQMRLPFEPSLEDREPKFYTQPQPALPNKPTPPPAEVLEQPA